VRLSAPQWLVAAASALALYGGATMARIPSARAIPPGADGRQLMAAAAALDALDVEGAAPVIERLAAAYPDDGDVAFHLGMLRFHQGDYAGAASALDRGAPRWATTRDRANRESLRALVASTRDATAAFVEVRSRDGRYVVRHAPGPDAVLVPYALEALAAADQALGAALGIRVRSPIRLEVFASPRALARVSTLTVEDIERTGTIALCKWDRLMITSPRALVRGYPWVDTLAHELAHLLVSRGTGDRTPVWLQEGIAKYLERRWRGDHERRAPLDPAQEALLRRALTDGKLLPFERLHPSIARLPSQQDAALAFAQVSTFVESYVESHGDEALRAALHGIRQGQDARDALAAAAGTTFDLLESRWRAALRRRPAPAEDAPSLLALRFKRGEGSPDESLDVAVSMARRHLRIGDLLWDRGRTRAAAVEYARARTHAPADPIVASRHARAALESGDAAAAARTLEDSLRRYPEHAPTRALLGAARLALGDREGAREHLREALRINPFDPRPHCDLATATDDEAERNREESFCRELRRR
jgi:Flp pilus assembly protein TadD